MGRMTGTRLATRITPQLPTTAVSLHHPPATNNHCVSARVAHRYAAELKKVLDEGELDAEADEELRIARTERLCTIIGSQDKDEIKMIAES